MFNIPIAEVTKETLEGFKLMIITVTQNARAKMEDAAKRAMGAFGK